MTKEAESILRKVISLREVMRETGCITLRSQKNLLRQLDDADLTEVAEALRLERYQAECVLAGGGQ